MSYNNPFPYSLDNKRYHTWNYYLKQQYNNKVYKVALNANFSCPNRDGTCGVGGCTFCGSMGSGEFAGDVHKSLQQQFDDGNIAMFKKWPTGKAIAYFQAYSNTYADLDTLMETFEPFIEQSDIVAISIATRADCLENEKIAYLQDACKKKDIWIELGLQSSHDETAVAIHRGHTLQTFLSCIDRLKNTDIKICVHLINSLPNETKEQMLETVRLIASLPIHAVKIHMLHIMEDTQMALQYQQHPFPILTKEEYIDIVVEQLALLPPEMIIQRLTGDGIKEHLITPHWTLKKVSVLNDIDKEMVKRNLWQGKYCQHK